MDCFVGNGATKFFSYQAPFPSTTPVTKFSHVDKSWGTKKDSCTLLNKLMLILLNFNAQIQCLRLVIKDFLFLIISLARSTQFSSLNCKYYGISDMKIKSLQARLFVVTKFGVEANSVNFTHDIGSAES